MSRARQASEDFDNPRKQSISVHKKNDSKKRQNMSTDTQWFRRAVFNLARGDFSMQLSSKVPPTPRTKLQAALRAVHQAVRSLFLQNHVIQVWQKRMSEGHALKAVRRGVHDMSRQRHILNMWQDQVEEDDAKDVLLHQFKELSVALDQLKSTDLSAAIQNVLNSIDPKRSSLERLGALASSHIQTLDDLAQIFGLQTSALQKLLSTWEWHLQHLQSSLHDQVEDMDPLKSSTTLWLSAVQQGLLKLSTVSGTPATVDFQTEETATRDRPPTKDSVCNLKDQMEQETSTECRGLEINPDDRIVAEDNVDIAVDVLLAAWTCQTRQEVENSSSDNLAPQLCQDHQSAKAIEGRQLPVAVYQQAADTALGLSSGVEIGRDSAHADLDQVEERQSAAEEEAYIGANFNNSACLSPTGKGVALIPHPVHISFDHEEERPSKTKEDVCFRTDSRTSARPSSVIKDWSDSTDASKSDFKMSCSPVSLTPISRKGNDSENTDMPVLCCSPFKISHSGASTLSKADSCIDSSVQCQMHQLARPDTASEIKAPKESHQKRRPSSRLNAKEQASIKEEKWEINQFQRVACKEALSAAGAPPSGFSKAIYNGNVAKPSIKLPFIDSSNVVEPDVLGNSSMQQTCESFMAKKSSTAPTKPCEPQSTYCRPLARYSKDHAPYSIEDLNPIQNKLLSAILEDDCSPCRLTQIVAEDMCLQHLQELPTCSRQHRSLSPHQVERISMPQLLKMNPAPPTSHLCRVSPRIHMQKTLSLKVPPALPSLAVRRKSC